MSVRICVHDIIIYKPMQNIRNIAIIAHVDHGKTTLVDKMLYTAHVVSQQRSEFNDQPKELILDNNDLERERGITILAKNVAIEYKGTKINIIDTPGHADFGGEVERVLNMADGVLLLVDAFEGAMPQTRFVLQKALEIGLKPIVVINKVDKLNCRPDEVQEEVFDLMCNLNATDDQLDFQTLYGSAKQGWMSTDWRKPKTDLTDLMDAIIEYIPAPEENPGTPQMLITSLDYNSYVGRIAIGRLHRGELKDGQTVTLAKKDGSMVKTKIKELHTFSGMGQTEAQNTIAKLLCLCPKAPGQPGEQQDHGEFRDFRGLKLQSRQIDPAFRPVDLLADDQHAEQQSNAHTVQGPGQAIPQHRRNPAEKEQGGKTDGGAHRLLLQIPGGNGVAGVVLALGIACRVQHRKSQRQEQQHQGKERNIHCLRRGFPP